MLKETSSSHEGKDHKSDAPTNNVARPHGKVRDFATRQQTYRYTKDDFFTLRSGERVPRLRGEENLIIMEIPITQDGTTIPITQDGTMISNNTGWNDDFYNTGWNDDSYNTRWNDDTYNTGWHRDPSDSEGYARRSPGRDWYDQPEEWRENAGRGRSLSPERDPIGREIHPGEWSGEQDGTNVDKDEQERRDEQKRRDEAEALLKEAAEFIQLLRMKDQGYVRPHNGGEYDGGQGDGNGGGDDGKPVGYDSSGESDTGSVYSADGDPELRATRRPVFDLWKTDGVAIDGQTFILHHHAYNSLFKSDRRDIMPDDITDALSTEPGPANPGSVRYLNPFTGTRVYVNPTTSTIVGISPIDFKSPDRRSQ